MPKRGSTNLVRAYSRVTTAFASRKKILPQALYKVRGLKIFANVLSVIWEVISIFIGIGVGILFGSLPIVIPGMPVPLKLGLAGGPLIIAILLGRFGSLLKLVTYTTSSANLMLRELGIALFLASVGLAAGENFVDALLVGNGPLYVLLGLFVTIIPLLTIGCIARHFFHINYHSIVGLLAGATTDPPTLAYAATLSEKNSSAVAYSTVYPLAMFLRILTGQLVLLVMWSYVSVG